MTEIIDASCVAGVVTADQLPVTEAKVFSEGIGESEGILILRNGKAYYIASSAGDLKNTLSELASSLGNVQTTFDAVKAAIVSLGGSPAAIEAAQLLITGNITQINMIKETLK